MRSESKFRILLLFSLFSLALSQTQRYEFKHSFRAPFYLGRGGTLPFWEFGGSAIVSEDRIRLTPAIQSRVGWVWNSVPADMDAWEVQLEYEIGGGGSRGADGLALWYVAEPKQEGVAMGSKEQFNGMAIFFDTFDNNGQNDEPRISLWINDGSMRYDPFDDGKHGEKGSCKQLSRDSRAKVRIIYRDGNIRVETGGENGNWAPCINHYDTLPKGLYFGLSAATGHLIDNHDVFSFITYNLDPWRRRSPAPRRQGLEPEFEESSEPQPTAETQPAADVEPVKPNPYLPQDPPNPYLPQQERPAETSKQEQPRELQRQQQQQGSSVSSEELSRVVSKLDLLTTKLDAMRNQQDSLSQSLTQLTDKVAGLQQQQQQGGQQQADTVQEHRTTQQEIRNLHASLAELRKLTQEDVNQLGKVATDIKNHVSTEQGNTYNNVARIVRELQQHVSALQTLVERGDREQNNALQELKSSKEELKSVVEQSGSVAWWVYFAFFQVCFGVAYAMWRKARDDANKKFL